MKVRTTVNLDQDIVEAARNLARQESISIGSALSRLAHAFPPAEWPAWISKRIQGYRQVSDASLPASAAAHHGTLVSLDAAILDLVDPDHRDLVLCILPAVEHITVAGNSDFDCFWCILQIRCAIIHFREGSKSEFLYYRRRVPT